MPVKTVSSGIRHTAACHIFFTFLAILLVTPLGFAQTAEQKDPYSGTLVEFEGEAFIQQQDDEIWLPVEVDIPLEQGDRIKTGEDSRVVILMDDGSMVTLEENTEITIRELEADYRTKSIRSSLFLWFGRVLSNITKFASNQSRFQVATPTLVAGVRGTEFIVEAADTGTGEVGVFDGKVAVGGLDREGNLIRGSEVFLTKGFQTSVKKGKRPKPPFGFTRRMRAHQKKMDRLRVKARERRRDLPQIMKKRIKARENVQKKWEKIRLEKSGKKPKTKDWDKKPSPKKENVPKGSPGGYGNKTGKKEYRSIQKQKVKAPKNTQKKRK